MARLPKRTRADHPQIAAQLFASPGTWGTVSTYPSRLSAMTIAAAIRRAEGPFTVYGPSGYYEARVKAVPDGTLLEACYTGRPRQPKPRPETSRSPEPERGALQSRLDAVRAIAARHEAEYGDAWHTTPTAPDADALWADALAGLDEEER